MSAVLSRSVPRVDEPPAKAHRQTAWASGNEADRGNALQIVSEELCESVNLCQGERVLDVAAGSFHAGFAAARRRCDVTVADHPSDVTECSDRRIEAESVGIRVIDGDAE